MRIYGGHERRYHAGHHNAEYHGWLSMPGLETMYEPVSYVLIKLNTI